MAARRAGNRLTYTFLATGLARSEAASRLQRLEAVHIEPEKLSPEVVSISAIDIQNPRITWLPTSGTARFSSRAATHDA